MNLFKILLFESLCFCTLAVSAQTKFIPNQELAVGSNMFFSAIMDQGNSTVTFTLQGPSDRWFGVGLGLAMADADVLMYTTGKSGATHTLGAWDYDLSAQSNAGVNKDAVQDWTIVSDNVNGNVRTVVATRLLNDGDLIDHILNFSDATIDLVWAHGATASYGLAYHNSSNRGFTTLTWQAPDITSPMLAVSPFSPLDDAIGVAVGSSLVVTFDEDVMAGTGMIDVKELNGDAIFESVDVTTGSVSFSGSQVTINLTATLASLTDYYVNIPSGAITDFSSNSYSGFLDNTTWNFSTLDLSTSIVELAEGVQLTQNNNFVSFMNNSGGSFSVNVISMSGQILRNLPKVNSGDQIDLSEYENSVLLIQVFHDQGVFTKKVVLH